MTVWQQAGSALNLNPHIHALVLDGVYVWDPVQERPVVRYASRPERKAMAGLVKRIRQRVVSLLLEFLRKLAALVPHPRFNLVVYHGVLAGNHR